MSCGRHTGKVSPSSPRRVLQDYQNGRTCRGLDVSDLCGHCLLLSISGKSKRLITCGMYPYVLSVQTNLGLAGQSAVQQVCNKRTWFPGG